MEVPFCALKDDSCEALGCQENTQAGEQQSTAGLGASLQPISNGSEQEGDYGEYDTTHQANLPEGMLASKTCKQRQNGKAQHAENRNADVAAGIVRCNQVFQIQSNYAQQHHVGNVQGREYGSGDQQPYDHANGEGYEQHADEHSVEEISIIFHKLNLPK